MYHILFVVLLDSFFDFYDQDDASHADVLCDATPYNNPDSSSAAVLALLCMFTSAPVSCCSSELIQSSQQEGQSGLVADAGDWVRSATREWKILRKGLPEHVYVQVFEPRMDLLRAYIAGPKGTPYDGGLFVFDLRLPSDYPASAPSVFFWSFGRQINPNLYDTGKVCLSLLNTWRGRTEQMWTPGKSTLLQVLVSIQSLILVPEPYYNEPGIETERGTAEGDLASQLYNDSARVLTLQIMLHTLSDTTLAAEPVVQQHYRNHVARIIESCADQPSNSAGYRASMKRLLPELKNAFDRLH